MKKINDSKEKKTVLAVDLGAESGRVIAVHFDGSRLELEALHRFSNTPFQAAGIFHWDIFSLWNEIVTGIKKGERYKPASIGVDTWGVDFGLIDEQGKLISNPVHYRDRRTENIMEKVFKKVSKKEIFNQTGIQFLPFNTIYQFASIIENNAHELEIADVFLTIPGLINFWLTGNKVCEFTNATTTQLYNPRTNNWAFDLMERLNIPGHIFPEIVQPGTKIGQYHDIPVIAVASHDTGSAVAAVPASCNNFVYVSSGTWSLVGIEVEKPVITEEALSSNLTNEGGVNNTYRLLKNVMGLWIVQQCRKTWQTQGDDYNYSQLMEMAEKATPLNSIINPNDLRFLTPGDHPQLVQDFCRETGQKIPQTKGEIVRCVLESLACAYSEVVENIEYVTKKSLKKIHIVGGGSQNALLNQMTADVTGLPVVTGPVEATVIGNGLIQFISSGEISDLNQGRELVRNMKEIKEYLPKEKTVWQDVYAKYKEF